jgi:kynurenine formamidase
MRRRGAASGQGQHPKEICMTSALTGIATADVVRAALSIARRGIVYELGHDLGVASTAGAANFRMSWPDIADDDGTSADMIYSVETVEGTLHAGTHIDGLAHVVRDGRIFGEIPANEALGSRGWSRHGMETVPPIISRCLIADVATAKQGILHDGYEITPDDLRACGIGTALQVRRGDVILVRTGKAAQFTTDPDAYGRAQPGVGAQAAIWLYEAGMSLLGTDTASTGPSPAPPGSADVHVAMIADHGVHLIENLMLDAICADGIREALFIALPLKIAGGTGSWLRPVAVV